MIKQSEDIVRAELERKSKDLYKVYNPTTINMKVLLNARVSPEEWTIHAKKEEIVPWYVAERYATKMFDKIIYDKSDKAVVEENEKRAERGFNKMDFHTEQAKFEGRNLKTMLTKREQIMKILIVGLYKEYGVGDGTESYDEELSKQNMQTESIVDEVLGTKKTSIPTSPIPEAPQNRSSEVDEAVDDSENVNTGTPTESAVSPEELIKQKKERQLENLAKAREARKNKNEKLG